MSKSPKAARPARKPRRGPEAAPVPAPSLPAAPETPRKARKPRRPAPPRRHSNSGLLLLILLLLGAAWAVRELWQPLPVADAQIVEVPPGAAFDVALRDLQQQGVLGWVQREDLALWARVRRKTLAIRAGEYQILPGTTPLGLLDQLLSGRVYLREVQFIEGWRFAEAWRVVQQSPYVRHTLAEDGSDLMAALGAPGQLPEGRFFPDTYRFPRGTTDVAVMRQAYDKMTRSLDEEWANRAPDLPYADPQDALTMASLVEKETAQESERAQIAGVFVRRLRIGMRLQTDPSVIYGLGDAYDGRIHSADLRSDTPYNTYTRNGLPPTPICLPGEAALHAALHPADGAALYFVARGDGTHQFSSTLDEHNAAVRRYQLGEGAEHER